MKPEDDFDGGAALPTPWPASPPALDAAYRQLSADLMQQTVPPMADHVRHALALRAASGQAVPASAAAAAPAAVHATPAGRSGSAAGRWRRWAAWGFSGAALCALALIGSVLLLLLSPKDTPELAMQQAGSGFVTVASPERWQQLLREDAVASAWLVPTEMPRERLAALGLPFDPARAGERISAELLMHPSGEVLAVRVLSP